MAIYAPQVGLNRMLADIIADTLTLRLFSNNVTPAATDTSASYTEVTGGGYASIALGASSNWTVTSGNPTTATYNSFQQFNFSGVIGGSGNVYGYYITRASGEVVIAQRIPSASIPFTPAAASYIKVRPNITLDNAAASSSSSTGLAILSKTADYTVQTSDGGNVLILVDASAGAVTISPYTAVGNSGNQIQVIKTDSSANTVTIDANSTETIDGGLTVVLSAQYDGLSIASDSTNWYRNGIASTIPQVLSKTADYTVTVQDGNNIVVLASVLAGAFTVTLPTAVGHKGMHIVVKKTDTTTNALTIDGNASETIDGALTWSLVGGVNWIEMVSTGAAWAVTAKGGNNTRNITSTYTTVYSDDAILCTSGTFTVNLIAAASGAGTTGKIYNIKNVGSGVITVDGDAAETIDGSATITLSQYDSVTLLSDGTNWQII